MRKIPLISGEIYHIFNRGVDKRNVFLDAIDSSRFLESIREFNRTEPLGSLYAHSFEKKTLRSPTPKSEKLVDVIAYCLNSNHYHLVLRQNIDCGISRFLQKIGTGYTNYFNERYKRSGALFQGRFKSVHIQSNEQLLHTSAYVNLNHLVHQKGRQGSSVFGSSWEEYAGNARGFCKKEIILGQFYTKGDYKKFALKTVQEIIRQRASDLGVQLLSTEELDS